MNEVSPPPNSQFEEFLARTNLIMAVDHASRAGNALFLTLFDQHPEIFSAPWMLYTYSYVVTTFGDATSLPAREAHRLVTETGYFRYYYKDLDENLTDLISRWGGDPASKIDRPLLRATFDALVLAGERVERKRLIAAIFYSIAVASGRDVSAFRHILLADAITLRTETALGGYSSRTLLAAEEDYPNLTYVSLCRDPRAQFASCRHQFVNQNGNAYGVKPGNALRRARQMLTLDFQLDNFAFDFWITYMRSAFCAAEDLRRRAPERTIDLLNEDINLRFIPTMESLCLRLGVGFLPDWRRADYHPTMMGARWLGTGAYSNRYQKNYYGPLKNESNKVSESSVAPNRHVTERWKTKLGLAETAVITTLFREEMQAYYPEAFRARPASAPWFFLALALPTSGELPAPRWLADARHVGIAELGARAYYALWCPFFYVASRVAVLRLMARGFFAPKSAVRRRAAGADAASVTPFTAR